MSKARSNGIQEVPFGNGRIEFRLRRATRRTLAITVKPDTGVLVTAPRGASLEVVKAKVRKRAVWIRRQQNFFREYLPPMPPRRYVSGETHCYLGRQYRLKVLESAKQVVKLLGRFIHVQTPRKADVEQVRLLVEEWYEGHARAAFARSLAVCLPRLQGRVRGVPRFRLRRMPKRWGSWTRRGTIFLNPELVRAPISCIEYVVMHELCHFVHKNHGKEFHALLRKAMPDWESRKARLERMMAT